MKLEFLDDLTDNGRYPHADPKMLIRIFDFDDSEARLFKDAINSEIISKRHELELTDLDFINPLNCTLKFEISDDDYGIKITTDKIHFVCRLTLNTYINMIEIIELLKDGYNWLYDPKEDDNIDLLISAGGSW